MSSPSLNLELNTATQTMTAVNYPSGSTVTVYTKNTIDAFRSIDLANLSSGYYTKEAVEALVASAGGAPMVIVDSSSTSPTITRTQGGRVYEYTQRLSRLTVSAIERSDIETVVRFTSPVSSGTILAFPSSTEWPNSQLPIIDANKKYTVSIVNNQAICVPFGVAQS